MKKCPFCGADIEDSARFCLYCMQPLTQKEHIPLHKKKKPQWLLITAALVALLLIPAVLLLGGQPVPESGAMPDDPQLDSVPPTSQIEPSGTPDVTEPPHVHSYSVENTDAKYQKKAATCTTPAIYYYSCACGERGARPSSPEKPLPTPSNPVWDIPQPAPPPA